MRGAGGWSGVKGEGRAEGERDWSEMGEWRCENQMEYGEWGVISDLFDPCLPPQNTPYGVTNTDFFSIHLADASIQIFFKEAFYFF